MKTVRLHFTLFVSSYAIVLTYLFFTGYEQAERAHTVDAQLQDICKQSWPDTLDGALARRRACGPIRVTGVD